MERVVALVTVACVALGSWACQTAAPRADDAPTGASSPGDDGLRTPRAVEQALDRAQDAYLNGRWDDAVVQATRVVEGAASPDQYYLAVKLLGLASCNRKDPRPVAFAWKRLRPRDRDSLRIQCEQQGLGISEEGRVTVTTKAAGGGDEHTTEQ